MIRTAIIDYSSLQKGLWKSNTTELPGCETERADLGRGLTHRTDRDAVSAHT